MSTVSQVRPLDVTIAVVTYRRPDMLRDCVSMLLEQAGALPHAPLASESTPGHLVRVLVVDNDPLGSARAVADGFGAAVRYVQETTPGIAAARNRALSSAPTSGVLIFIDDDERPHPGWLENLVGAWHRTGAAAVAGAVVSDFQQPPDSWIVAGDFFRRRRLPTDTPIDVAATNNLLLDMAVVSEVGLSFDVEFGLSGGEDTLFTRTLSSTGRLMTWCNEAVVTDVVPADRLSRRWVLMRAFSSGNSVARVSLKLNGAGIRGLPVRGSLLGRGLARTLSGGGRAVLGTLTRSRRHQARGLRTACRGAGMASGAMGYVYLEYGRGTQK